MKAIKTNASRKLDQLGIAYSLIPYETKDGLIDGVSVAEKIHHHPNVVYKTLVTQGTSHQIYVCLVRVNDELDLKQAAKALGEKQLTMLAVKEIQSKTGYVRGGCSPIGMKRDYPTIIDESVTPNNEVVVSGGKIGVQLKLRVEDLVHLTHAKLCPISK